MTDASAASQVAAKWRKKRGSLIMALHEIQSVKGYVPWEDAVDIANGMGIPLARIYEVLTFYNFFKLDAPGKAVISVCTGTACYLKGNDKVLEEFKRNSESTRAKALPTGCSICRWFAAWAAAAWLRSAWSTAKPTAAFLPTTSETFLTNGAPN